MFVRILSVTAGCRLDRTCLCSACGPCFPVGALADCISAFVCVDGCFCQFGPAGFRGFHKSLQDLSVPGLIFQILGALFRYGTTGHLHVKQTPNGGCV